MNKEGGLAEDFCKLWLLQYGVPIYEYVKSELRDLNIYITFTPSTAKDRLRHQLAAPGLLRSLAKPTVQAIILAKSPV